MSETSAGADVTRDGVQVRPGQIWRDMRRRSDERLLKVFWLDRKRNMCAWVPCAAMIELGADGRPELGARVVKIALSNLRKPSFELVRDKPADEGEAIIDSIGQDFAAVGSYIAAVLPAA